MIRYKWYSVLNDKEDVPKGIVGVEKIIKKLTHGDLPIL